jgi:hypothetical protein
MAFIDLAAFAALSTLALAALGDIDSASRALREVATPTRMATLSPRRVSEHLPWRWRLVPHAIATAGLILIAWRLTMPVEGRRPFVPLMFVGAAAVFLWLYEVWITDVVTGPLVSERQEPSRSTFPSVPMLFTTEIVLVTYPLVVAHALLDANWETAGTWPAGIAVASAVPAIIGCALALSSNLSRRRYAAAE